MGPRKNGHARGRHARGDGALAPLARLLLSRAFFLAPIYFLAPFNPFHMRSLPPGCHGGESCVAWVEEPPRVDATSGLSLLQFFSLAPRGFSPGTSGLPSPQKPTLPNSNLTGTRGHILQSATWVKKLQNSQLKKCYTNFHVHGYIQLRLRYLGPIYYI